MNRDEILALDDVQTETVQVKTWNSCTLRVRGLTGSERDKFEQSNFKKSRGGTYDMNLENIRARLVSLCVVNEDGSRMFKDEDVSVLGKKNAAALDQIFDVARRLSGITKEDVEELAKN